jgi:CheY-like chemotaxis protein
MSSGPPDDPASGLRVLLVEDESMVAMLLEDMLADFGCEVIGPVARVGKALAMAQREPLDIAILDVNLNGQEVYPVAAALATRGIPFVFATGYDKHSLRRPYDDRPILPKPFRRRDVHAALAEVRRAKESSASARTHPADGGVAGDRVAKHTDIAKGHPSTRRGLV